MTSSYIVKTNKNLLKLINGFDKGYKIDIEKSVVFLYTNNKLPEKDIKPIVKIGKYSWALVKKNKTKTK